MPMQTHTNSYEIISVALEHIYGRRYPHLYGADQIYYDSACVCIYIYYSIRMRMYMFSLFNAQLSSTTTHMHIMCTVIYIFGYSSVQSALCL